MADGAIVPKPGGNPLLTHDPKRRRMLLAIAGGGALALIFLLSRGLGGGATAAPATTDPSIDPATGVPYADELASAGGTSTFADNGDQAAALGDQVTSALGTLDTDISGQLQAVSDALTGFQQQVSPIEPVTPAAPGQLGTSGNPAGGSTAPGFHAGHSKGHEYYVPGVGWVSQARYAAYQKTGSVPAGKGTAAPAPKPAAPTPAPTSGGTAPGYHAGHSKGHEYYIPGFGWVSQARYQAWQKTGKAK
jgi:hypothetical protein